MDVPQTVVNKFENASVLHSFYRKQALMFQQEEIHKDLARYHCYPSSYIGARFFEETR